MSILGGIFDLWAVVAYLVLTVLYGEVRKKSVSIQTSSNTDLFKKLVRVSAVVKWGFVDKLRIGWTSNYQINCTMYTFERRTRSVNDR